MEKRQPVGPPKRGEIHLVSFDPTVGADIRKTRPALVIQNDIGNRYSPITIVAAISSSVADKPYPTDVLLTPPEGGLREPSVVMLNQIRSIDKRRMVKRLGALGLASMIRVDEALRISLGLIDL